MPGKQAILFIVQPDCMLMSKKLVFFLILLVAIIMLAAFVLKPGITGNAVAIEEGSINVAFCPHQGCSAALVTALKSANDSIRCAFFDMNLQPVADILSEKSASIPVQVVFDDENKEHVAKLHPKFQYKFDTGNQLSHNKFCVVDSHLVFTGSMNPTLRDDTLNNNNILLIESAYFAENYQKEFDELWKGEFGAGRKVPHPSIRLNNIPIENYFCPEDSCEKHVVSELRKAKHTVYFMTFSFTSEQIADAILTNGNLIDIKGIFEKSQAASNYSQYKRLRDFGLNVRIDGNKYNMHHKVFIIDNETAITGSYNPTTGGDEKNDENVLIIRDRGIAQLYLEEFSRLFYS